MIAIRRPEPDASVGRAAFEHRDSTATLRVTLGQLLGIAQASKELVLKIKSLMGGTGGEGGIRTPDTVARMPHFECGAFNRSATSPTP